MKTLKKIPSRHCEKRTEWATRQSPEINTFRSISFAMTKAFTLVELIVVITILVILGTIAFISLGGYAGSARDGARVSDITNMTKGLELFQVKSGSYPLPTAAVSYTGGMNTSLQQWGVNGSIIGFSTANPVDPVTKAPYVYSVIGNGLYYQIGGELESSISEVHPSLMDQAYADGKVALVKGNYIPDPSLPSLIVIPGSVPAASGSWGLFSPNVAFVTNGSTSNLASSSTGYVRKKDLSLKALDNGLMGYWDMETLTDAGLLRDLSGNGNNGTFSGGMNSVTSLTGGFIWMGRYFNDASQDLIDAGTGENLKITKSLTIIVNVYSFKNESKGILTKQSAGYIDAGTGCWVNNYCGYQIQSRANEIVWRVYDTSTGAYATQDRSRIAQKNYINTWIQLAYRVEDGLLWDVFINGRLQKNTFAEERKVGKISVSNGPLLIGKYWNDYTSGTGYDYFNGIIDDVKIYSRPLSNSEILQHAKVAGF